VNGAAGSGAASPPSAAQPYATIEFQGQRVAVPDEALGQRLMEAGYAADQERARLQQWEQRLQQDERARSAVEDLRAFAMRDPAAARHIDDLMAGRASVPTTNQQSAAGESSDASPDSSVVRQLQMEMRRLQGAVAQTLATQTRESQARAVENAIEHFDPLKQSDKAKALATDLILAFKTKHPNLTELQLAGLVNARLSEFANEAATKNLVQRRENLSSAPIPPSAGSAGLSSPPPPDNSTAKSWRDGSLKQSLKDTARRLGIKGFSQVLAPPN
jgi:hypothetical protein